MTRPTHIWVFDGNHRVYRQEHGRSVGGPIWRKHWVKTEVVGETRVSWILAHGFWFGRTIDRVPKTDPSKTRFAFSEQEIDDQAWIYEHRYRLVQKLQDCTDPEVLKAVAALVGFTPTEQE